jgi:hypothetical protein
MKETVVTPVRLAQDLAQLTLNTAYSTVRHPLSTAARAVGVARGAVLVARQAPGIVADTVATRATSDAGSDTGPETTPDSTPDSTPESAPETEPVTLSAVPTEQGGVPDLEPPDPADRVLVVEAALASQGEQPIEEMLGGRVTEPHAASRDEEHGDAALQRAELDELREEIAETEPAGQVGVETPAGTTGADVAFNPDTAEADLHQPRTEELVDPATAKALRSEAARMRRASDPA